MPNRGDGGAPADENSLDSTSVDGGGASTTSPTFGGTNSGGSGGDSDDDGSGHATASVVTTATDGGGTAPEGCTQDSRCADTPAPSCDGDMAISCADTNEDGCAEFIAQDCAPGTCQDGECAALASGESCSDPLPMGDGDSLSGPDFASDFQGDLELKERANCKFSDTDASDAVMSVELQANDQLVVTQRGDLQAVFAVLRSCASDAECIVSEYGGRGTALTYTAATDETVLVVVDAYQVEPITPSYEIWLNVNPECGNGTLEGLEECDDANVFEGDGCSPSCSVEFPWDCDAGSPTVCQAFPSLETLAAGDPPATIDSGAFGVDDRLYYTVTFEDRILLDIVATSNTPGTGDVDLRFYTDWSSLAYPAIRVGDEIRTDVPFEPGTYLIEISAKTDLPYGFEIELTARSPGVCGDYETSPFEECDNGAQDGCEDCSVAFGWVCDGASPSNCNAVEAWVQPSGVPYVDTAELPGTTNIYWMVEFGEDVVLTGSITSNYAPDYYYVDYVQLTSSTGEVLEAYVAYDGTLESLEIPAGYYELVFLAYTGMPDGYTLTLDITPG